MSAAADRESLEHKLAQLDVGERDIFLAHFECLVDGEITAAKFQELVWADVEEYRSARAKA